MSEEKENSKVTVENIVDGAIIAGFKTGMNQFMENMEDALRRDMTITEAGGAEAMLQTMLESTQTDKVKEDLTQEVNDLSQKLAAVL